ncbi:hypothetical protein ACXWN6_10145, partial [Streptococcus pyogenes]
MKNIYTISAQQLMNEKNLSVALQFLGYFYFNSYCDEMVITHLESFGDADAISKALDTILKTAP